MQFISQPIEAIEPSGTDLPRAFRWGVELLEVAAVRKEWRGTKEDRGDVYLKRHWYEFETNDGRIATVYFDRAAKPGKPRWWLYTLANVTREERIRAIAGRIRDAKNYRWVGIYDVRIDDVCIVAYSGPDAPAYPSFPRDRGLTGRMLRTGMTVCVGDVTQDRDYLTAFGSTRSEVVLPIRVNGEIVGTLDVESEHVDAFGDCDLEALERAAESLAAFFTAFDERKA